MLPPKAAVQRKTPMVEEYLTIDDLVHPLVSLNLGGGALSALRLRAEASPQTGSTGHMLASYY